MEKLKNGLKKTAITIGLPCIVYLLFMLVRPAAFCQAKLPWTLLEQSIQNIILAWGISFEMVSGNMDMSIGAELVLGQLVGALFASVMGLPGLVLGVFVTAAVIFALKALVMRVLNTRSMVIFIALTYIIGAIGYLIMGGRSAVISTNITQLGRFPYNLIIFVLCGAIIFVLQRYTVFSAHCKALGGNGTIAASAGINKHQVETTSILIASLYAAVSGLISISRGAGSAPQPGLESLSTVFGAMSGVFISFVLAKYIPQVIAIAVGVYSLNIITFGLLALNVPSQIKDTVNGGFLLLLMCASVLVNRRQEDKLRRIGSAVRMKAQTAEKG